MLGTTNYERSYEDKRINERLVGAYQKAYENYMSACDRYDKLVTAYRVLKGINADGTLGAGPDNTNEPLPYTEKIMKQMIEDAYKEKDAIADHARDCVKHLRSLSSYKYKM